MTVDLALSDDQLAIDELFGSFFARESPPSVARAAEPHGFSASLWTALETTGAQSMALEGAGLSDLVVVAEHAGRWIAPVPLVDHWVATRAAGAQFEGVAGFAVRPAVGGVWSLVPAGAVAELVAGLDGDEFVAVTDVPPGDGPRNHAGAPLADRATNGRARAVIGGVAEFQRALDEWRVLTASALVGIAAAALDMAVDYVKARHQFGVPVGSFQSVQHGLAELTGPIDGARLLVHKAAWAADGGASEEESASLAAMAFVFASDTAVEATHRSLHYHGGYGFAEEYDIQLYYRRARGWSLILGDPAAECRRVANLLWAAG